MKKWVLMLFFVLVLSVSLSNAIKTITVSETELVSLKVEAADEDNNQLSYAFTAPLDQNGEWQTNYGDSGEYKATITVSDGELNTSEDVLLVVKKKNVPPSIDSASPDKSELSVDEGGKLDFSIKASDLNKDLLAYSWRLDDKVVSDKDAYTYAPDYGDAGQHTLIIIVSDGDAESKREWAVTVNKVDRKILLDSIKDITADEGSIVSLGLPDFKKYNLEYTISEPIGNSNHWETTYTDAGRYDVTITIKDREFSASKQVKVNIVDIDRPPLLKPIANAWINENQKVAIGLEASDPDGDKIEFSAENMPEGASLKGSQFEWATSYDTVKKDNALAKTLDKFHLLYIPVRITFKAKSRELESKQSVWIMVKDVNRAPALKDIPPITINEGEEFVINPEASDPDGDNITYSYSGWVDSGRYRTGFDDAGTYKIKVTASDGFLADEKYVTITVNDINRPPVFQDIGNLEINENEKLELPLNVNDPEGDSVNISAESLPKGSKLEDNIFTWTPGYDTINADYGVFTVTFEASDGNLETIKQVNITVYNVNRPPKITAASPGKSITINQTQKLKFEVVAEDPDGDELTYTWKFGLLEQYKSGAAMVRQFTSPGVKEVKVIVSDGKEEVEYEWNVNVIGKPTAVVVQKPKPKVVEKPKEVAKKPVQVQPKKVVEVKPVPKVTAPKVVEKAKTPYLYDQYTITTQGDNVIDETKESFVVYR